MQRRERKKIQQHNNKILVGGIVLLLSCIGCPIKFLTGISCAGCGMTRAWLSALKFDFIRAFYYHPLFWTIPVIGLIQMNRKRLSNKVYHFSILLIACGFIGAYVIRLFDMENTVVTIALSEGLFGKVIKHIMERNL